MTVYWTFFVLTWLTAAAAFAWQARRHGVAAGAVLDAIALALPAVIVCAHLASMWVGLGEAFSWRLFLLRAAGWRSGYSPHGAVLGALAALALAARLHRLPARLLYDCAAPAVFAASAVGRTGCFLTPCCWGAPTTVPWGVRFTAGDAPLPVLTPPMHPVQLYEIAASLGLLALLPRLARRWDLRPGSGLVLALALGLFLAESFGLEFFRVGGTSAALFLGLSKTHLVTLAGAALCALLVARHRLRTRPAPDAA